MICAASKAAPAEHEAQIQQLESAGQTVVLVMRGETLLGILALRDTLRDDARQAVDALHLSLIHILPDVNAFPHPLFSKIQARISRRPKPERLSYSCNGGTPELQQALVDYLRVSRGVHCQADQILITEGIHQAIDLVTRMLCDSGDLAWVEEPSY